VYLTFHLAHDKLEEINTKEQTYYNEDDDTGGIGEFHEAVAGWVTLSFLTLVVVIDHHNGKHECCYKGDHVKLSAVVVVGSKDTGHSGGSEETGHFVFIN